MIPNKPVFNIKKLKNYADWYLLAFLLLFLDVKLAVKVPAIVLIYLFRFNFQFGFSWRNSRLPLFYPIVIAIAVFDFVVYRGYSIHNYPLAFLLGIGFWAMCILAIHQTKLFIERNDVETIHRTLLIFFIINVVASLLNLVVIILKTGAINPYLYQGEYQKYFVSTGDYVKGITFDTSTTNAVLNAFGVLYFFERKNSLMILVCMAVLLLTGSNFTNLMIFGILAVLFIFKSSKDQKSLIVVCMMFLVIFMAKISPQNDDYLTNTVKIILYQHNYKTPWPADVVPVELRPDSTLSPEEKRQKLATLALDSIRKYNRARLALKSVVGPVLENKAGKIIIPKPNLNDSIYQNRDITPPEQRQLALFVNSHSAQLPISSKPKHFTPVPGKYTGALQTVIFLRNNPAKIVTGDGIGNFSSKLAFRTTGLRFTGGYPAGMIYINPAFLSNHLDVYLNFFSRGAGFHSLTNSPFSTYDQMLAEYGALGFISLLVFYLHFFARQHRKLTYGLPLLFCVLALFLVDYWFEQLSVIVMFELMIFLDIKENSLVRSAK